MRVLPFLFEVTRHSSTGASSRVGEKRSTSERDDGQQLLVWAVRASDGVRVRFHLPLVGLNCYRAICVFRESSATNLEANRSWLEERYSGREVHVRWISDMRVTDVGGTTALHGCELRVDFQEDLRSLCDELFREKRLRVLRWDRSDETAALTFMRRRDLSPFGWWDVLATVSSLTSDDGLDTAYALADGEGRFFSPAGPCLPRELSGFLKVFVMRVRCLDRSAEIRGITIAPVETFERDGTARTGLHREIDDCTDEVALLREALRMLRSTRIDLLTGPDPRADLGRVRARARFHGIETEQPFEGPRGLVTSVRPSLGALARSDVRAYAKSMRVFRRSADDALSAEDRFRTETNLLLRVLRERRVIELELFVHAITCRYPFESCGLTVGEHGMEGALRYVRHAYHQTAEMMNPPRFVMEASSLVQEGRLPGGYNLPPQIGIHRAGVTAFDFRSFYPSCIRSFNLDAGLVSTTDRSAEGWVPLSPLHIGDASNSAACDCCRRDTFRWGASRVLGEVLLGGRRMRIWQNDDGDEDTCYVCPSTASVASELLERFLDCRARVRVEGDAQGEMACKVLANSVSGVFGYFGGPSRRNELYDAACYRAVVQTGRSHLLRAVLALQSRGHRVLYGDTDSLFVDDSSLTGVEADVEEIGRRVTGVVAEAEARATLERSNGGRGHFVELRASERFEGMVILAKKRYVARLAETRDLKFCGFSRVPRFDERCDRAFVEFCVRDALVRRPAASEGVSENDILRAVLQFVAWFDGRPDVRGFWFLTEAELISTATGDSEELEPVARSTTPRRVHPASAMWLAVDRRMKDRNFRTALFPDVEWGDYRWMVERMLHNHFHRSFPEATPNGRSVMLTHEGGGVDPTCEACKREEVANPVDPKSGQRELVLERVRTCDQRACELWHAACLDW
ncbi:hypothetical protein CYMTET_37062 [Cymbomonas tetramitiformis]|uniref:DNA polymerase n=1 Tax=Cymbomonas tetramitiformis TaxID=36881 RepID=A0AAE0CER8_9CHLO|nr:hypothetical protein CYMTET_37062 [Cymbomonas tetramitiformis]